MVRKLASHQCDPGSNPGVNTICGLSLLLVLSLALRGFFSGYSGFPNLRFPYNIENFTQNYQIGCGFFLFATFSL